ncbi:hypothetical protein D3C72_2376090 [compost metagenome]
MPIPSARLIRVLSRLIDCYGPPDATRLDNGPEMISEAFTENVYLTAVLTTAS